MGMKAILVWLVGWRLALLLTSCVLLGSCTSHLSRRVPETVTRRELRFDTETASRLRHATAVRTTTGVLATGVTRTTLSSLSQLAPLLLTVLKGDKAITELEQQLVECARQAEHQANFPLFGNRAPTREECGEEVEVDGCGETMTQAMALGRKKHAIALACARAVLAQLWPTHFSIEQRYRFYRHAQITELVTAEEEKRLIEQGCFRDLWRTIKPDIVLHADNDPLRAVLILDFKFPCPDTNLPRWTRYHPESAYAGATQDGIYSEALGSNALIIFPQGISK